MVGTPGSWDPTISISGKDDYKSCTWSPCSRFVAALIGNIVEIRNQLTFELLTTLQPTDTTPLLVGPLAYSPDGCSLACASNTVIVIWDIQTGGVAKEIWSDTRTISLVWSLDGRTIGTLNYLHQDTSHMEIHVNTYNVVLGAPLFAATIHSHHKPHLWAYKESFQVLTTEWCPLTIKIRVSEVQSHLIKISEFTIDMEAQVVYNLGQNKCRSVIISFSPNTYHTSVLVGRQLYIHRGQNHLQVPLLREEGHFLSQCFSSDGSLFAASRGDDVTIWKFSSNSYLRWREFQCQDQMNSQFSPTSFSILSHCRNALYMSHLDNLPTIPKSNSHSPHYAALSHSGSHIATTYGFKGTIMIIDSLSQGPPQFIETGMEVKGLLLTSNVLLVVGSDKVVAWLLTEEWLMNTLFNDRNYNNRIWEMSLRPPNHHKNPQVTPLLQSKTKPLLHVEGQIGVIEHGDTDLFLYHTTTGEVLQSTKTPLHLSGPGLDIGRALCGQHYPYCHNLSQHETTPEDSQHPSQSTLQEGWVQGPEGKHRLWLHVEWRKSWNQADWCNNITTQFSIIGGQPVIIRF